MKKLIVANWKCNPTSLAEAKRLAGALNRGLRRKTKAEVVVCPPFVYLSSFKIKDLRFKLGSQDCFWEEKGAFTGEISVQMLEDLKVQYVIVGHSERRQIIEESDEVVNQKLKAVLQAGLTPILCVGETAEERRKDMAFKVLERQIKQGLKGVAKSKIGNIVIAYEPIWAIGSGNPCEPDDALTVALFIRKVISKLSNKKSSRNLRVLYGGSVKAHNAEDCLASEWINGLLVGGASLKPKEFLQIIRAV